MTDSTSDRQRTAGTTASPYSTGGGGVTLEHRFGALFLARMLAGTVMPELRDRTVSSVAFQQVPSSPVDDLVLSADSDVAPRKVRLSIACRRRPQLTQGNAKTKVLFQRLVSADVASVDSDDVEDRIGIAVAGPQGPAREVAELADLARNQPDADSFFTLIYGSGQFGKPLKNRLTHLRRLVAQAQVAVEPNGFTAEERCWSLLTKLYIFEPDIEPPNEQSWGDLAGILQPLSRDQTLASSIALRNELHGLATGYAQTTAVVSPAVLRRRLHSSIDPVAHRRTEGWRRLELLDQEARASVRRTLSNGEGEPLRLPRTDARAGLLRALQCAEGDLLIHGESGVGKSAAVLDATERDALDAGWQVISVNLRQLPDSPLELTSGLSQPFEVLLDDLTAPRRLLVIDGADAAVEDRRELFLHLVRSARASNVMVVAVAATEGSALVREVMADDDHPAGDHLIGPLTDDEIDEIVSHLPELARIATDPKSRELLRRLIVVDLLARAGDPGASLSASAALQHVWQQLVRDGERGEHGLPDRREQVMLQLAAHALEPGDVDPLLLTLDGDALVGLRRSGLLRPPSALPWERVPEFTHDLIRSYAVARRLLGERDPAAALNAVGSPRWALPAARLACQILLEQPDAPGHPAAGRLAQLQRDFDALAQSGHGVRWSDVPTEATLVVGDPRQILNDAWPSWLADDDAGIHRLLRVLDIRHQPNGRLDAIVAEPVVAKLLDAGTPPQLSEEVDTLLQNWLTTLVMRRTPAGQPTRANLATAIIDRCTTNQHELGRLEAEQQARLAARSPEDVAADNERRARSSALMAFTTSQRRRIERRTQRRRAYTWISDSLITQLALLGADLGSDGEAVLRQIAEDDPYEIRHAVEPVLAGHALAQYDPDLLSDLVRSYYIDEDAHDEDDFGGLHGYGIRDHSFGGFGPLAAYYRGPFIAMFRANYSAGVRCLNQMLNHAARQRVRVLTSPRWDDHPVPDESDYGCDLSIGDESRRFWGDGNVWLWYRGTGVGPYPCMSALQALELVTDEIITQTDVRAADIVPFLLAGAQNLAMAALALGVLVRHLESAGEALDAFLVEPDIWQLEFSRATHEHSGLGASVPGVASPERRSWTLREVAMMLTLRADPERASRLVELGEQLVANATSQLGSGNSPSVREHLASVRGWADALNRDRYEIIEEGGQILIQQTVNPEIEAVLGETNADLRRENKAMGLLNRHGHIRDNGHRPPDLTSQEISTDLATAQDLVSNPPAHGFGAFEEAPIGVAASAIELGLIRGVHVAESDLRWSASLILEIAAMVAEHPNNGFDDSLTSLGQERPAAQALPFLLLPAAAELRRSLGIDTADERARLVQLNRAVAWGAPNEARLAYARAMDALWASPCGEFDGRCHHEVAVEIVDSTYRDCVIGPWDSDGQRRTLVQLEPPYLEHLAAVPGEDLIVRRLSAAIRALGAAAMTGTCQQSRIEDILASLLDAHRRAMLSLEHGYHHSDSDSLIAARAVLWQASTGRDEPLLDHVAGYLHHHWALTEALRAIGAAAEEQPDAAEAARRLWPSLMDKVLDAAEAHPDRFTTDRLSDNALSQLLPNAAYQFGYLTAEASGDPASWRALLDWSPQVERWLPHVVGDRQSIDALVIGVRELEVSDQVDAGLLWIERIVGDGGNGAANTYILPEWLRERQAELRTPEQRARWQRLIDVLVTSGDTRVADLAD